MANKFYVVWQGRSPGIYASWAEAEAQVKGYPAARFHGFPTRLEAERAFALGYEVFRQDKSAVKDLPSEALNGYAVDASLPAETGLLEYRGVKNDTRAELFRQGPFEDGANNVGEFLALVHALALFKRRNIDAALYSDSVTALAWLRDKRCRTELRRTDRNAPLFELIERAEAWLSENPYTTRVLKWDSEAWGENPADFGRK
jgi:ribonuclease HI